MALATKTKPELITIDPAPNGDNVWTEVIANWATYPDPNEIEVNIDSVAAFRCGFETARMQQSAELKVILREIDRGGLSTDLIRVAERRVDSAEWLQSDVTYESVSEVAWPMVGCPSLLASIRELQRELLI